MSDSSTWMFCHCLKQHAQEHLVFALPNPPLPALPQSRDNGYIHPVEQVQSLGFILDSTLFPSFLIPNLLLDNISLYNITNTSLSVPLEENCSSHPTTAQDFLQHHYHSGLVNMGLTCVQLQLKPFHLGRRHSTLAETICH